MRHASAQNPGDDCTFPRNRVIEAAVLIGALCVAIAIHLLAIWRQGAFIPTSDPFPAVYPVVALCILALCSSTGLARFAAVRRRSYVARALAVLALLAWWSAKRPIQMAAVRRDIGGAAAPWAEALLRRPKGQIVIPHGDRRDRRRPKGDESDDRVRDDRVPTALKNSFYRGAWYVKKDDYANGPFIILAYDAGILGGVGYSLGGPSLRFAPRGSAVVPAARHARRLHFGAPGQVTPPPAIAYPLPARRSPAHAAALSRSKSRLP